jgi:hypothetical protein
VTRIDRSNLTFEQAEGAAPLPRQLQLQEVSQQLRAQLWHYIHHSISLTLTTGTFGRYISGSWETILRAMHVEHYHLMIDDFGTNWNDHKERLRNLFQYGTYAEILGFLQWIIRCKTRPSHNFAADIDRCLERCQAAYRVVNGNTIVPISSQEETQTLDRAFSDLVSTEFNGARQHLKLAAERATARDWADCIRESINAVEATVRCIDPNAKDLRPALAVLEKRGTVHGSLKQGLLNLYGYASDEKGLRHSLVFKGVADVDQTDALFMLGACASFISYLVNKARASGLINQ